MVSCVPRFSFLKSADMSDFLTDLLKDQRHEHAVRVVAVLAEGSAEGETGARVQRMRRLEWLRGAGCFRLRR